MKDCEANGMKTLELSGVTLQLAGPKCGRRREKVIEIATFLRETP